MTITPLLTEHRQNISFTRPLCSAPPPLIRADENHDYRTNEPATTAPDAYPQFDTPGRETAQIWPWLFATVIVLALTGIWVQKALWMDNRWMRSHLIGMQLPLENRAKDWQIVPQSVQAKWITRNDDSRVLLISGTIKNLLNVTMPTPEIELSLYDAHQPQLKITERRFPVAAYPDEKLIEKTPLQKSTHVKFAAGKSVTPFSIVVESLTGNFGDFTLSAKVKQ